MTDDKEMIAVLMGETVLTKHEQERVRLDLLKRTICKGSSDDEFALFMWFARKNGLDAERKQVYPVWRWDQETNRKVMAIGISVDGYRVLSERTGKFRGILGPYWAGEDGIFKEYWLPEEPPIVAKVGVIVEGFPNPVWGIVMYREMVQTGKEGKPTVNWKKMPALMLAKCAEVQAHRKGFPNAVYLPEGADVSYNAEVDVRISSGEEAEEPEMLAENAPEPEGIIDGQFMEPEPEPAPEPPTQKVQGTTTTTTTKTRPFKPDVLREEIHRSARVRAAEKVGTKPNQRTEVKVALNHNIRDDKDRKDFILWLTGKNTLDECPDGLILAIYNWLEPVYSTDLAVYVVADMAYAEIAAWVLWMTEMNDIAAGKQPELI